MQQERLKSAVVASSELSTLGTYVQELLFAAYTDFTITRARLLCSFRFEMVLLKKCVE